MPARSRTKSAEPDPSLSAVDRLIASIELGIQQARFAPGQRLIEAELMRDFGISRGPVREAFRRLTERGLLQWEHFRGVSVIRMSKQQVVDFSDIRAVLEGYAASRAAARLTKEGRQRLREIERVGDKAVGSPAAYDDYNVQFHRVIRELSGNAELNSFIDLTKFSIFRLQFNTVILSQRHLPRSREDHAKIVAAIAEGDSKRAEVAMRQHVQNTTMGILQAPDHFFAA